MISANTSARPIIPPYFALISGVLAVSTGAIFARLADAPALVIAAYRVGIAVLVMAPLAIWKTRHELYCLSKGRIGQALVAGIFLAFHFAAWISSLDYTAVADSVVLVNTNPVWVAVLTPLITREPFGRTSFFSIAVSLLGVVLIGAGDFAVRGTALWGDLLALLGSVCAAVYLLLGRKLRRNLSLLAYIFLCYGSAAAVLWLAVLILRLPLSGFSTSTWSAFLALALLTQLVGHTSYNWALKWFSTGLIAVSLLGEPIGSSLLAYIIFGERLTWMKAAGGTLILTAIYLAAVGEKQTVNIGSVNRTSNIERPTSNFE